VDGGIGDAGQRPLEITGLIAGGAALIRTSTNGPDKDPGAATI